MNANHIVPDSKIAAQDFSFDDLKPGSTKRLTPEKCLQADDQMDRLVDAMRARAGMNTGPLFPAQPPVVADTTMVDHLLAEADPQGADDDAEPENQTAPEPDETQAIQVADADAIDRYVEGWCDSIEQGWGPARLGEHETQLISYLAVAGGPLTSSGLHAIVQLASKRLLSKQVRIEVTALRKAQARQTAAVSEDDAAAGSDFVALSSRSPDQCGIYSAEAEETITNFEPVIEEDVTLEEDVGTQRIFRGQIKLRDKISGFEISADDFPNNAKLMSTIYKSAGPAIQVTCKPEVLRTAISVISAGRTKEKHETTNFGWVDTAGSAYLVPGGVITKHGFQPAGPGDLQVSLSDCGQASYLGMRPLASSDVREVKKHIAYEFRALHDERITDALLGMVSTAVLRRFAGVTQRFTGWFMGETGTGKTLLNKLGMSFFGDYSPVEDSRFVSWSSTPNSIERAGYYYRDALFLVDDFKTGTAQYTQVVRILQAYADGAARGRLKADATFNPARPIRGQMVVTAENMLDNQSSSVARTIIIPVPEPKSKSPTLRDRCLGQCCYYSGLLADYLVWLMQRNVPARFANHVHSSVSTYQALIAGQPNDMRIASNFGVLAAAYLYFAEYLSDVWPNARVRAQQFINRDLVELMQNMVQHVKAHRDIDVFWDTLQDLMDNKRVRFDSNERGQGPQIGKIDGANVAVCPALALQEVQKCLKEQGRAQLALRPGEITSLLVKEQKIPPQQGSNQRRIAGEPKRCFFMPEPSASGPLARFGLSPSPAGPSPSPGTTTTPAGSPTPPVGSPPSPASGASAGSTGPQELGSPAV
jgi:Domain of unknown function (DUF927)